MDHLGFIHEKLDIKILILYVLRRLPGTVEAETLRGLVMCDDGIGYFDYSDCLSELLESDHIRESEEGFAITEKGARNADTVESSLPYSVRVKALRLIEPVEERLRREAMIVARHKTDETGCTVELGMSDAKGEVAHLRLLCADEEQARKIEKRFRKNAEGYYQKIMELLSESP
jgi:hypothetical protein